LCHANTIDWKDIFSNVEEIKNSIIKIEKKNCTSCNQTCCLKVSNEYKCHCWEKNICQALSKSICDSRCEGRCFGKDIRDCCHPQCAVGCTGPSRHECLVRKIKFVLFIISLLLIGL
jgi:hypothetical protein